MVAQSIRILAFVVAFILLHTAIPVTAWHSEDEQENPGQGSVAGDPRILEDAEACLNETRPVGEVTCVALYAHIFETLNPVPFNTQRPAECAPNIARGFSSAPNVEPHWTFARLDGYTSSGFVEYEDSDCESPRIHYMRDLASTLRLSPDFDIRASFYLSADMLEFSALSIGTGPDSLTPSLGAMPCLTLHVSLETGRYLGDGETLATGQTTKTLVSTPYGSGLQAPLVPDPCPSSAGTITAEEVTEFEVNLGRAQIRQIEPDELFSLHAQWYQHNGTSANPTQQDNAGQNDWNLHTGSKYPNRIVLPIEQPVEIHSLRLLEKNETRDWDVFQELAERAIGGAIQETSHRIHLKAITPWGNYDLDTKNIQIKITDSAGQEVETHHIMGAVDTTPKWVHHYAGTPTNLTFPWDLDAEDLKPGTYTLHVSLANWQHTGVATAQVSITIPDPQDERRGLSAPGLLILLVLGALGLGRLHALRRNT